MLFVFRATEFETIRWTGGSTRLIVTGDVVDRGTQSFKIARLFEFLIQVNSVSLYCVLCVRIFFFRSLDAILSCELS